MCVYNTHLGLAVLAFFLLSVVRYFVFLFIVGLKFGLNKITAGFCLFILHCACAVYNNRRNRETEWVGERERRRERDREKMDVDGAFKFKGIKNSVLTADNQNRIDAR